MLKKRRHWRRRRRQLIELISENNSFNEHEKPRNKKDTQQSIKSRSPALPLSISFFFFSAFSLIFESLSSCEQIIFSAFREGPCGSFFSRDRCPSLFYMQLSPHRTNLKWRRCFIGPARLSSSSLLSTPSPCERKRNRGKVLSPPFAKVLSASLPPPLPSASLFYSASHHPHPFMASTVPQVPWKPPGGREYPTWLDLPNRLLRDRILLISQFLDEEISNQLIATLLYLYSDSPSLPISLYFNSPGGLLKPCMALYDTINSITSPCTTINIGLACGAIAFLCAAGSPGKRFALPNARFLMQRGSADERIAGVASEVSEEVRQALATSDRILVALAKHTRQPLEKLQKDFERDFYLSASEAKLYGIIDAVLLPKSSKLNDREGEVVQPFGKFDGPERQTYQMYRESRGWGGKPPVAKEEEKNVGKEDE